MSINKGISANDGSKKARIERAALELFAQDGIDHTTTKAIAKLANVSEGLIYRHFKNKEALAQHLMRTIHTKLTDIISSVGELNDLGAQIRLITSEYCEIADKDWLLFRYHILNLHRFPNLSENNPLDETRKILESAMARGEIPTEDAAILASMSLGVVLQTAQAKVLGFIQGSLSDHLDLFVRRIEALVDL